MFAYIYEKKEIPGASSPGLSAHHDSRLVPKPQTPIQSGLGLRVCLGFRPRGVSGWGLNHVIMFAVAFPAKGLDSLRPHDAYGGCLQAHGHSA